MDNRIFTARVTNGHGEHLHESGSASSQGDAEGLVLKWVQEQRDEQTREDWELNRKNDPWWLEEKIDGDYRRVRQLEF